MAKKQTKKPEIQPLTDFEESLLYMSYRYAIGRHTIHSHCHAGDILENFYERLKLTPERMAFNSKDMNDSIEENLRWGADVFIENKNYSKNIFPYELYIKAINREKELNPDFDMNSYKKIEIYVDTNNEYIDHYIKYYTEEDSDKQPQYRMDSLVNDLAIWNNVAKCLDLSQHHHVKVKDGSVVEYVEICSDNTFVKVLMPDYIHNTAVYKFIPDDIIIEYID